MKFLKALLISFIFSLPLSGTYAFITTGEQGLDSTLADSSSNIYSEPQKIYVAQVTTESIALKNNPELWVKNLYYYSITRLHFSDVPFNYFIDENGVVYQGRNGYAGVNPSLEDGNGVVLIGYLSNNPSLTARASASLSSFVKELTTSWGISTYKAVKLSAVVKEGELSKIRVGDVGGVFATSVLDSLREFKPSEKSNLKYVAKIEAVESSSEVQIGERANVKVRIKNMNEFPWFVDKDPIYVSVRDGKESKFAINQVWKSFSKPATISDDVILPLETVEVSFGMDAKVLVGDVVEKFEVHKYQGQPFQNSFFEVKFAVSKGENKLVEVSSSEYGFANIRECKWFSCKILDSADNGAVFILLKEEDGWSKVKFGNVEGWVMSRYLKKI